MASTVITTIEFVAPYSQSRAYEVEKLQGEGFDDYELRTWRNRLHVDGNGEVFIPPMAFKNSVAECAKFLSIPVPGKGKATYTKHFEAGVMAVTPVMTGIKAADVAFERLFVPADGRRGGSKRVYKYFPVIPAGLRCDIEFLILDDTVLQTGSDGRPIFQFVWERTGRYIGVGRFRPRNNGFYGRFQIVDFTVVDELAMAA